MSNQHAIKIPGFVIVPEEPTEEMIQAACLEQCLDKYDTYEEWWENTSSGVSRRIRQYIVSEYKTMIAVAKKQFQQ